MEKGGEEEITEEQRKRAESNRAAALAKRKAILSLTERTTHQKVPWELFKCRRLSPEATADFPVTKQAITSDSTGACQKPEKFLARLEICSPDSFSVTPVAVEGFVFPGEDICFEKLRDCLSNVCKVFLEESIFRNCSVIISFILFFGLFDFGTFGK